METTLQDSRLVALRDEVVDRLVTKTLLFLSWVSGDLAKWSKRDEASARLLSAENTFNTRSNMYECPSCHNLYKWKKSMLAHLRHQCKQPPRFECLHCSMRNYQKTHIIRHLRVHHPHLRAMFFDRKLNAFTQP